MITRKNVSSGSTVFHRRLKRALRLQGNKLRKLARLVSVGGHETNGTADAHFLAIADRVLYPAKVQEPTASVNQGIVRNARFLLHYREN